MEIVLTSIFAHLAGTSIKVSQALISEQFRLAFGRYELFDRLDRVSAVFEDAVLLSFVYIR